VTAKTKHFQKKRKNKQIFFSQVEVEGRSFLDVVDYSIDKSYVKLRFLAETIKVLN